MRGLFLLPLALPLVTAFNSYRSVLTDCLNQAQVPILLSSSTGWSQAIQAYNLRFMPAPNVVAMPRNVADVKGAVTCAYKSSIKVTVKGGGHSYGAYGLAGTLVIDMVAFQTVTVDPATQIASVGAGVRLGNMATQIFSQGGRALPHGTCPSVGIGGHATLGGFGYSSRLWGLMTDSIVKLDVVLADGTVLTVSPTSRPDLFWALRGAGPGFAIVTTFYCQTLAAPSVNINWSYSYTFSTAATAATAFQYATNWAQQNAPKELGFGIYIGAESAFVMQGVYTGSQAAFTTLMAPMLAQMKVYNKNKNPTSSVKQLGWIQSLTALGGTASLTTPPQGDGSHDNFYVKSLDTHQATPLSLTALTKLFTYLYNTAPPSGSDWFIIANLYGGPGSKITSFPPSTDPASTSSYAGRDTGYVWQLYGYTGNTQFVAGIIPFIKGMVDALGQEAVGLPAYAPYPDTTYTQAEAQTRYWGAGVARLKSIKALVDPKGILYNPQGF